MDKEVVIVASSECSLLILNLVFFGRELFTTLLYFDEFCTSNWIYKIMIGYRKRYFSIN